MNFSTSAKATISSNFRVISCLLMPRMAPLRYTFSRPVSSGWKPVPTSSKLPTRPWSCTSPVVGSVIWLRTFRSVAFPAPPCPHHPPGRLQHARQAVAQRAVGLAPAQPVLLAQPFDTDDHVTHSHQ